MQTTAMLETYPAEITLDRKLLAAVIEAALECSQACTACADACLSEDMIDQLRRCIRTNLDCADICDTTARILSRHTGFDVNIARVQLQACAQACRSCGDECEAHASMHEHCRICADACRHCEAACNELLAVIG